MQAIILAAGKGTRLKPLTLNKPKPLLEIRGKSILENMVLALRSGGVEEIILVTGYKNELFSHLTKDLGLHQVIFSDYASCNSSQSLLFVQDRMKKGTIILNGDLFIMQNFTPLFKRGISQFLSQKIPPNTTSWGYICDENCKILDIDLNASEGYGDGIAYFDNEADIAIFKEELARAKKDEYWEYAVLRTLDRVNYYAFSCDELYIEIDSFSDALFHKLLTPEEIALQCSDDNSATRLAGITNINYLIQFQGEQKVIRIPGSGTDKIIDRELEQEILTLIDPLNITPKNEFYGSGIKLSEFLSDFKSLSKEQIAPRTLHKIADNLLALHSIPHTAHKEFEPILLSDEVIKYENLSHIKLATPREHKTILEIAKRLDKSEFVLCHRDLQAPNILFNGIDIKLIDFEYAGFTCREWEFGNLSAELELEKTQIEDLLAYYNARSHTKISLKGVIEGQLMSNYIWALWGWIYNRIDLGRDYLARFTRNLKELENLH